MEKLARCIEKILSYISVFFFLALIGIVLMQVVTRLYPYANSPSWTEEAARFCFIFAIGSAAPIALNNRDYVRVDYFIDKFSKKVQRTLDILIYIALTAFFIVLTYYAYEFIFIGEYQTSPTIGIKMIYPYAITVFIAFFMALYSLVNLFRLIIEEEK